MDWLQRTWHHGGVFAIVLWPLSLLFRLVAGVRRSVLRKHSAKEHLSVPVVVVGNLSVGGAGKTPLLMALARTLAAEGYRPGVVSRGYGGRAPVYPFNVEPDSSPEESGDEPLLIRRVTGCPVVVDPQRLRAVRFLEAEDQCDIILSDDGLQHYRLPRTLEIAVIDGQRGLGNGLCLPAGPLREPPQRLLSVDFVVSNGELSPRLLRQLNKVGPSSVSVISLQPAALRSLTCGEVLKPDRWQQSRRVHGVAGIGYPERFFATLVELGFSVIPHSFPDHHNFSAEDVRFDDDLPVVMTAKDAVKCQSFATDKHWALEVEARIPDDFVQQLLQRLRESSSTSAY